MTSTPTRREANKQRTRAALVDAMYTLLEAEGPEAVTAERVAEAAGISRRTFFNYYESVDALIAAGSDDVLHTVRTALAARPADEPLLDAAYAVIEELFTVPFLAEAVRAWRAVEQHPSARRFALQAASDHTTCMAAELGRKRLDPGGTDPFRSSVLISVLITAFDEARRHWLTQLEGEVDAGSVASLLGEVRRSFDIVRPAFGQA